MIIGILGGGQGAMVLFWETAWQNRNGELGKIDSLAENNLKAVFACFLDCFSAIYLPLPLSEQFGRI